MKKKDNIKWVIQIIFFTFFVSVLFSSFAEIIIPKINILGALLILIIFIGLGIIFDMIGVAFTSVDEEPFHAKSSRKIKGANIAVKLIKNNEKVSSFCNDVVGDICGILSGAVGTMMTASILSKTSLNDLFVSLIVTALIASFTIGGKAIGKTFAIKNSEIIVFRFSKILSIFYKNHSKYK